MISLSILSYQSWYLEIALVKFSIKRKTKLIFLFNTVLVLFSITGLIFYSFIQFIPIIIMIYFFTNIFLFKELLFKVSSKIQVLGIINLGTYSTFLKSFANLIWRYSAFLLIGGVKSGILFVGFAIGSFLATIFDVSYGGYYVKFKNNIYIQKFHYFINFLYIVLISIGFLFLSVNFEHKNLLILTSIVSIIGSFFMISGLKKRQILFSNKINHSKNYKIDIISYCYNMLLIPILFIINDNALIFAYFLSSLFFYLLYRYLYR